MKNLPLEERLYNIHPAFQGRLGRYGIRSKVNHRTGNEGKNPEKGMHQNDKGGRNRLGWGIAFAGGHYYGALFPSNEA
jgi:hypothetical protein